MESRVNSHNHIIIQGWMLKELNLSGNDLLVYAVIWGFSQDGETTFYGSRQYLADWCNCSIRTIQNSLNNLIELGLIEQIDKESGNVVKYKAHAHRGVCKNCTGGCENFALGCENFAHNNIDNKIDRKDSNTILKNSTAKLFDEDISVNNSISKRTIQMNDDFTDKMNTSSKEKKNVSKEPKLNLYQKMKLEINNRYTNISLQNELENYLSVRMAIKDKPLKYLGQWKGILNTLDTIGKTDEDKIAIVRRAAERGWASFYALSDYKYDNRQNKKQNVFAEQGVKSVRPEDVEGGQFSGQIF